MKQLAQTDVNLIGDDGLTVQEQLRLADLDPIFATSFDSLIKEAFAEGKHFFIARIKSRQAREDSAQDPASEALQEPKLHQIDHSHFFSAYGILKLIFQKKGQDWVGRFHDKFPVTVRNPITNQVIINITYICDHAENNRRGLLLHNSKQKN